MMGGLVIGVAIAAAFAALAVVEWSCYRLGLVRDELPARRRRDDERGEVEDDALIAAAGVVVLVVFVVLAVMGV